MDFTLTEAQRELADLTRRIVTEQVTPSRLRRADGTGARFDRSLWTILVDAGLLEPTALVEQCAVLTELGRGLAPVPYLPTVVAAAALTRFGSDAQVARWARPALTGTTVLAVAAPGPDALPVTAVPGGSGWRLSGQVSPVTAGPVADAVLVATDHGVFVVADDDAGVELRRQPTTDHDDTALLALDGTRLDVDRLLDSSDGSDVGRWLRARAAVALAAHQLGVVQAALDLTAEHARTRVQFGRPVGGFQAVSQRLADAYVDVRALELTVLQAAWLLDEENPDTVDTADEAVATARFWTAEAGHRVAHTLVHVHGGTGIDLDHPAHRYYLAATRGELEHGGATAALRELGSLLATT